MITSLSNDKVKLARGLARRRVRWQERCFIVEGARMFSEMLQRDLHPRYVLHTETALQNAEAAPLLDLLVQRSIPRYLVSDEVMAACTDTVTPSGLLAVVPFPELSAPTPATWVVVLDNVRTPGNLGTILRTAAAAGVDQVLLSPGTVDLYNPKVVRGGAGAHFCLPVFWLSWREIEARLQGLTVWLATVGGDRPYGSVDWEAPVALLIGGEAHGASQPALALADGHVTIPMARDIESLNAAVAAGVLLFEIARRRSGARSASG